jgi:hypothetical protein
MIIGGMRMISIAIAMRLVSYQLYVTFGTLRNFSIPKSIMPIKTL